MLTFRNAVAGLGLIAVATLGAGPAFAAPPIHGYVTTGLNLRAGPSTSYPAVVTMRGGDPVTIYGCLSGWSWCDIDWHGNRGWAAGQYLQVTYRQHRQPILSYGRYFNVPSLSFSIGTYWNQHYHGRGFYGQMQHFGGKGPNQPHINQPPKGPLPTMGNPSYGSPHGMNQPHMNGPHMNPPPKGQAPKGPLPTMGNPPNGPQPHMNQPPQGNWPKGAGSGNNHRTPDRCPPGQHRVNGACQ
jgi:uncharacterized protein YraI